VLLGALGSQEPRDGFGPTGALAAARNVASRVALPPPVLLVRRALVDAARGPLDPTTVNATIDDVDAVLEAADAPAVDFPDRPRVSGRSRHRSYASTAERETFGPPMRVPE
jgi:hypothetical protein